MSADSTPSVQSETKLISSTGSERQAADEFADTILGLAPARPSSVSVRATSVYDVYPLVAESVY